MFELRAIDHIMASSSAAPAPPPALVSFARATIAQLTLWPALKIAVDGGWGGAESVQKRTWLASAIVDSFEEAAAKSEALPDAIYVEEMLLQVMADEFEVVIEDGSAQSVAANIVKLWQETMVEGRTESVKNLEEMVEKAKGRKIVVDEKAASDEECQWSDDSDDDSGDDSGESGEGDEAPQLLDSERRAREEPEVDEDGFTVVKGRHKGHR